MNIANRDKWLEQAKDYQGQHEMNRETWLRAGFDALNDIVFKPAGFELPEVYISVGFQNSKRALASCWFKRDNSQDQCHIFISPEMAKSVGDTDSLDSTEHMGVLDVLAHELIHALRPMAGHGKDFKYVADRIGLIGKMTSTKAGPELRAELEQIVSIIGEYPTDDFFSLKPSLGDLPKDGDKVPTRPVGGPKKQTVRNIKVSCECGYSFRTSQKNIDKMITSQCHCCDKQMKVG